MTVLVAALYVTAYPLSRLEASHRPLTGFMLATCPIPLTSSPRSEMIVVFNRQRVSPLPGLGPRVLPGTADLSALD